MIRVVFKSVRELSELVRTGRVSPVELAEVFLDRVRILGEKYNAVVTVTRERAMEEAYRAEKEIASGHYRGLLHGIPYGVKDLLATSAPIPTTWGAMPFRGQVFNYDATVIERLEKAGAVLIAKLAMIELAGGMGYRQPNASFTGPPRNPWNLERWTGGSSSGSAAAVCAGLAPFSIGSETWGSILSPANNCGVTGLRPTYGRVSRHGAMALSWTLDKLGPLCLTADDCGTVLENIAGKDLNDPASTSQIFTYDPDRAGPFRLAVLKGVTDEVDEDIRENFGEALKILNGNAIIEEITLPELPYEAVTRIILYAETASAFEDLIESGRLSELTAPEDRFLPYARTVILAKDYLKALRLRAAMAKKVEETISPYDAIVGPSRSTVATAINKEFRSSIKGTAKDIMGAVGNSAGLPSISVPNGFSDDGLPTGLQFMGKPYDENMILAVARTFQSRTDWHQRHPLDLA